MESRTLTANRSPGILISERFRCYRTARRSYSASCVITWRTGVTFVSSTGIRRKAKKGSWKITVLNIGFTSRLLTYLADTIVLERVFLRYSNNAFYHQISSDRSRGDGHCVMRRAFRILSEIAAGPGNRQAFLRRARPRRGARLGAC